VLVRGGTINEREEVEALRNALAAIERPDDELAVFATLRGPLFALADGALLEFRETIGSLHPFRKLADGQSLREIAEALKVLRELHRGRNRRPIADTIARLLSATRAHAGIAIWPTGEQALANVMRLMDMARRYEAQSGATSLRGFVDELEARAEREQAGEVPVVEEGTEGVRIMTVHRAKGLEFPVVILADITCNETAQDARRYVDTEQRLCALRLAGCAPRELLDRNDEELRRDGEESVRVLYVATTRARDLLVVPVVGDERQDGWLGKLSGALYPGVRDARSPLARRPPGCPEFGALPVGTRPSNAHANSPGVAAGMHRPELGEHRVVWWDPSLLKLNARETMGLRQSKLLQADAKNTRSEQGRCEYEAWRTRRDELLKQGETPTLRVSTATELSMVLPVSQFPEAAEIQIEEVPRTLARPHGTRFGTLVHSILSRVAIAADAAEIKAASTFYGRTLGASTEEIEAAGEAVASALRSPLMRRAATASEVRRECALTVMLDDGIIVEGVADLAFVEGGERHWIIVDFKTDLEFSGRLDEYRTQLALYLRAVRQATGLAARGILLWI
jgi:ATP-dependent exoDNAse (exonuclease V) beta subunit